MLDKQFTTGVFTTKVKHIVKGLSSSAGLGNFQVVKVQTFITQPGSKIQSIIQSFHLLQILPRMIFVCRLLSTDKDFLSAEITLHLFT